MFRDTGSHMGGSAEIRRETSYVQQPITTILGDEHVSRSNLGQFAKYFKELNVTGLLSVEEIGRGVADRRLYQAACRHGWLAIVTRDRAMNNPREDLTYFALENAARAVVRATTKGKGLKGGFNAAASLPVIVHIPANHTNEILEECLRNGAGDLEQYLIERSAPVVRLNQQSVQPVTTYDEMFNRCLNGRSLYDVPRSADMRGRAGQARKPKDRDRQSRQIDPQPNNARSFFGYRNFIAAFKG